jgi:hypothetical protein
MRNHCGEDWVIVEGSGREGARDALHSIKLEPKMEQDRKIDLHLQLSGYCLGPAK